MKLIAEKGIFTKGEIVSLFVYPFFFVGLPLVFLCIAGLISGIAKSDYSYNCIAYYGMLTGIIFCLVFCIWLCVIEFKEKSIGRMFLSIILICIYIITSYISYVVCTMTYIEAS